MKQTIPQKIQPSLIAIAFPSLAGQTVIFGQAVLLTRFIAPLRLPRTLKCSSDISMQIRSPYSGGTVPAYTGFSFQRRMAPPVPLYEIFARICALRSYVLAAVCRTQAAVDGRQSLVDGIEVNIIAARFHILLELALDTLQGIVDALDVPP